jgi:hypothetical protein
MAELNRALALVRAIGMTDEMASDWLAAALGECLHLSDDQFKRGCAAARRECTHHAQIVPTIVKSAGEGVTMVDRYASDWDRALQDFNNGYPALRHEGRTQIGNRIAGYLENIQTDEEF